MKLTKKQLFLISSVAVLVLTTVYWSLLSAFIQQQNSDQLADPALFENWDTFSQSVFPTQHTFFLKWPLFFLVQLAHGSPAAFIAVTVAVCLLTVVLFAWILSRIEKRPDMLGLLFLALSAVLLLVPIEPKPGSLLPVGMGMIATRNIEYIIFLGGILWLFKKRTRKQIFTPRIIISVFLLTLLFVSDQLFVGLLFGGGILLLISSSVFHRKDIRQRAADILAVGAVSVIFSMFVFIILRFLGVLDSPASAVGPYGVGLSFKDFALGSIYAVMSFAAQFGANPVSGTVIAADIPTAVLQSLRSPSSIGYLVNAVIAAVIVAASFFLVKNTLIQPPKKKKDSRQDIRYFGLFIIMSALASIGFFVATKHYYAADARYIGLVFFAGFIALAIQASRMKLQRRSMIAASVILAVGCVCGTFGAYQSFQNSREAYNEVSRQNTLVAQALQHHLVKTLAADYWRVYPIVTETKSQVKPLPLSNCFEPRDVLASKIWAQHAYQESFAYLLTTEQTGTGYPACELSKARVAFGSPSDTLVVEGTAEKPKTLLLFYDKGINKAKSEIMIRPNDTSLLRNLDELKDTGCDSGRTILQTAAHQDDDILFMNPDLFQGVNTGDCVRTIYFTAGDAGAQEAYWLGREEGAKASYARMFGIEEPTWRSRDVQLSEHHQVKIARLLESDQVRASLIFMRLPDGNVDGSGFASDRSESLNKLMSGAISSIGSVDGASTYSRADVILALGQLMEHYGPVVIRTQATRNHGVKYKDHSDHITAGRLTQEAFDGYYTTHPGAVIRHYIGYPIRAEQVNVTGDDLILKKILFFTYAAHDSSTCTSDVACEKTSYKYYLNRQYTE